MIILPFSSNPLVFVIPFLPYKQAIAYELQLYNVQLILVIQHQLYSFQLISTQNSPIVCFEAKLS